MKKYNLIRVSILVFTFLGAMVYQPNWLLDNFWYKADFYDSIPFNVPFIVFLVIQASLTTVWVELWIRFIKRFA
jgi:hypothetical protein